MTHLDLTASNEKVLDFYKAYIKKNKESPRLKEAGKGLKMHPVYVCQTLKKLEDAGYIQRRAGQRNVVLTDKA